MSQAPVIGCKTTAGAVNRVSATTVTRVANRRAARSGSRSPIRQKKGDAKAGAEQHRGADNVQGFDEQVGVHGEYATADASPPRSSIHPSLGLYVGDVVSQRVDVR